MIATLERSLPQHSALGRYLSTLFLYSEHSTHIACSSVTYTAVLKGIRQFDNDPVHICCNVKSADESTTDEEKDILRTSMDQLNAKMGE